MEDIVSVIITTYKRPVKILKRAVDSVINQTYTNLEIIIVNDNPIDYYFNKDIKDYIESLNDNRVRYIQHSINKGACEARNTGIKNSTGKYIAFLDDDDEWLNNKIEFQKAKFNDNNIGLVYCGFYSIKVINSKEVNKVIIKSKRLSGWVYKQLILNNFIGSTSLVMLKRECINDCGYFNINLKSSQDYELWLRISKKYMVDFIDKPLVNYYDHDGERITLNIDSRIQGLELVNEINHEYIEANKKVKAMKILKMARFYKIKYGKKIAIKKWIEAILVYPFHYEGLKTIASILLK